MNWELPLSKTVDSGVYLNESYASSSTSDFSEFSVARLSSLLDEKFSEREMDNFIKLSNQYTSNSKNEFKPGK